MACPYFLVALTKGANEMTAAITKAPNSESLASTASAMLCRTRDLAMNSSKYRALELARLVLEEAPNFGAAELRDPEILRILESEAIGLATFKKALSAVRQELTKPPRAPSPRRKTKARSATKASPPSGAQGEQKDLLGGSAAMKNVPRSTL